MSKTKLTKQIEHKLSTWQPKKLGDLEIAYLRSSYMEFEVPVTHGCVHDGLVDCVWCAEGFTNSREYQHCRLPWYINNTNRPIEHPCTNFKNLNKIQECVDTSLECAWRGKGVNKDNEKRIICFEIKISLSDFKSKNGHNFVGNLNYYVIPKPLLNDVINLVPEHIGIIVYMENSDRLYIVKESTYQNILEEDYNWFLLTCVNKRMTRENKRLKSLAFGYREMRDLCSSMLFSIEKYAKDNPKIEETVYINNYKYLYETYEKETRKALGGKEFI